MRRPLLAIVALAIPTQADAGEEAYMLVGAGPGYSTRPAWTARMGSLFLKPRDGIQYGARMSLEAWADRIDSGGGYTIGPLVALRSNDGFATLGAGVTLLGFVSHRDGFDGATTLYAAATFGMFLHDDDRAKRSLLELSLRYERHIAYGPDDTNLVTLVLSMGFGQK